MKNKSQDNSHFFSINSNDTQTNSPGSNAKLSCANCGSELVMMHLSEKDNILMCSNKNCLFPLDSEYMKYFIFPKSKIENSLERIQDLMPQLNKKDKDDSTSHLSYEYNFIHNKEPQSQSQCNYYSNIFDREEDDIFFSP